MEGAKQQGRDRLRTRRLRDRQRGERYLVSQRRKAGEEPKTDERWKS